VDTEVAIVVARAVAALVELFTLEADGAVTGVLEAIGLDAVIAVLKVISIVALVGILSLDQVVTDGVFTLGLVAGDNRDALF